MSDRKFSLSSFIAESSAAASKALPGPSASTGGELGQVATRIADGITPILAISGLKKSEQQKFEESAVDLVTSSEFIDGLSEKVGVPLDGETKEQFVSRAKSELRTLLTQKLLKKK